jgi:hypothetical protein
VEVAVRRNWATSLLITVGIVLLGAGVVRVLATASGAGLVSVVTAGALLLVIPLLLPRLERVTLSPSGLELQLARDAAEAGAPDAARILERTELARFAESYSFVHEDLRGPAYRDARIHLQDLLVERAAALARREKFKAAEVRAMFANGSLAMRVLALGLMQGDPPLADGATILASIGDPRSDNEQYQGMLLAEHCWPRLPPQERAAILALVESDPRITSSTGRRELADKILALPTS